MNSGSDSSPLTRNSRLGQGYQSHSPLNYPVSKYEDLPKKLKEIKVPQNKQSTTSLQEIKRIPI
jgi:hypothetical protein